MSKPPISLPRPILEDRSHVLFSIKSPYLQLERITEQLGVSPTSGFEANAKYMGKMKTDKGLITLERERPDFGIWHFDTRMHCLQTEIGDHVLLLLSELEPRMKALQQILNDPSYYSQINLVHFGPTGFALEADTMGRLARLTKVININCYETKE